MLQKIVNTLYRYPKYYWKEIQSFGGLLSYLKMKKCRRLMEIESCNFPPLTFYSDSFPIYFLTGKKYLYQTIFCLHSLLKNTTEKFSLFLVDDGSFDDDLIIRVNKQLLGCTILNRSYLEKQLKKKLPITHFPILNKKRQEYPHIKKIIDVHLHQEGFDYKLVLDSDMLFWKEPKELIDWLKNPMQPIYMLDCSQSYGYSIPLMQSLCESKIPELVNVGAIGLNNSQIEWEKLETWIGKLELAEGKSYYLEQALSAMIIGTRVSQILPSQRYIVNPSDEEIKNHKGILQHYVDLSKKGYFIKAWKYIS